MKLKNLTSNLKVLSVVLFLAPIALAEGEHAAPASTTPAAEPTKVEQVAPAEHVAPTVEAKPVVAADVKTVKKSFCGKTEVEASTKCNDWLGTHHKDKVAGEVKCEVKAATKADKCKAGHVAHGEVQLHK